MKVLHLTLRKKWFDMIASGEKKEEYREIKQYWVTRLQKVNGMSFPDNGCKQFDYVHFTNGYGNGHGFVNVQCLCIEIGHGKPEWGATDKCFIIKLGEIIK